MNVEDALLLATPSDEEQGLGWYDEAHRLAAHLGNRYGYHPAQVAAVIAALSPQTEWQENIKAAQLLLEGRTPRIQTARNISKAERVLLGESPETVFAPPNPKRPTGHKVRAFFANIADPTDPYPVTIDRHATDIALGRRFSDSTRPVLDYVGSYDHVAEAYRHVGKLYDLLPNQVQAITWIARRRANVAGVSLTQTTLAL